MEFEKSDLDSTHTITSNQVMTDKDTGRVVAVFYNDYDIESIINSHAELESKLKQAVKLLDSAYDVIVDAQYENHTEGLMMSMNELISGYDE